MRQTSPFDLFPAVLFEKAEEVLTQLYNDTKTFTNFPPTDIYSDNSGHSVVEMAVAGFTKDELEVTIDNNVLYIRGTKAEIQDTENIYLRKGIAYRNFVRDFEVSPSMKDMDVTLINGILKIVISFNEKKETKKFDIK